MKWIHRFHITYRLKPYLKILVLSVHLIKKRHKASISTLRLNIRLGVPADIILVDIMECNYCIFYLENVLYSILSCLFTRLRYPHFTTAFDMCFKGIMLFEYLTW